MSNSMSDLLPTRRAVLGAAGGLILAPRFAKAEEPAPKQGGTMTIMFYQEPPMLVSLVNTQQPDLHGQGNRGAALVRPRRANPHPQWRPPGRSRRTG